MKYTISSLLLVILLSACGNSETAQTTNEAVATETAEAVPLDPNAKMDPVCDMVKDSTWTDYTVHNADTVWFCSETCKSAFVAKPEKYAKKG